MLSTVYKPFEKKVRCYELFSKVESWLKRDKVSDEEVRVYEVFQIAK